MSKTYDDSIYTSLFIKLSEGKDECDICEEQKKYINCCDRCGSGVCYNCCMSFPHQYDTLFIVCNNCSAEIEKKFKPNLSIDLGKLRLLKQRIKKNKTYARRKSNLNNK